MPLSTNRGWPTSWWKIRRLTSTPSRPATQISDVCFDSSLWPAIALRSGQRHSNWPFSSVPTLTMSNCTGTYRDHSFHRQKQTSRYSLFATHQVEKCNLTLHETLHCNAECQTPRPRFEHCHESWLFKTIQTILHNLYVSVKLTSL